ncbi:MAG: tetratricopeptide repeat protein [Candidatus Obscuribacterales bacterium]|nr:tetratricopeptide repeat protein [Candidatus Obscuribacterales bacterium]
MSIAYTTWQNHLKMAEEALSTGNLDMAHVALQLALQVVEEIEHNADLKAYTLIMQGRCSWSRGDLESARVVYQKAAEVAASPEQAATACHDLARLYHQLGDFQSCEQYFNYAIYARSCQFGDNSEPVEALRKDLASLTAQTQTQNKAQPASSASALLTRWQQALENAELEHRQGNLESFDRFAALALELGKLCGKDTPEYCNTLHQLASLLSCQGRIREAERNLLEAYGIKMGKLGAGHASLAETTLELSVLYFNNSLLEKAEPWAKRTVQILESISPFDSKELACALNNLAVLYHSREDYGKAEPLYQRALVMKQNLFGPGDIETINLMRGYADLLQRTGRLEEAEQMERMASGVLSGAYAVQPEISESREEYIPI